MFNKPKQVTDQHYEIFIYCNFSAFPLCLLLSRSQTTTLVPSSKRLLKYIEFSQIGDPADVLEIKEERSRPLKSGEVRVGVLASPINPSDLLQISGKYGVDPVLPSNPGSEGVGRVLEVSAEVKTFDGRPTGTSRQRRNLA